jgi:hypothetical protein
MDPGRRLAGQSTERVVVEASHLDSDGRVPDPPE